MSEEAISLEETNKIRISLGLKPIPIEKEPKQNDKISTEQSPSISLEETNRLRISLGLKPIPGSSSEPSSNEDDASISTATQDEIARANWLQKNEKDQQTSYQARLKRKIQESRERSEKRIRLEGKSLGQDDMNSAASTKDWLKNLKARPKSQRSGASLVKKFDEQENYGEDDLTGLKVAHKLEDIESMATGQDSILTLKDTSVLEDQDDELESSVLKEQAKQEENLEARKGLKKYRGFVDEEEEQLEEDEQSNGMPSSKPKKVLSKYDDKEESSFILSGSSIPRKANIKSEDELDVKSVGNVYRESLDFDISTILQNPSSDYLEPPPEVKFKKPKKRRKDVKKRTRTPETEEFKIDPAAQNDDDQDLQDLLSQNRRRTQMANRKKLKSVEELAEEIDNERQQEVDEEPKSEGLVVSDTTGFLSIIDHVKEKNLVAPENVLDVDEEEKEEEQESRTLSEEPLVEEPQIEEPQSTISLVDAQEIAPEEPSVSGGLGDVLKVLRTRGVIKTKNEQDHEKEKIQREQRDWVRRMEKERILREVRLQEEREKDRVEGKYDKLSAREREQVAVAENRNREIEEALEAQRRFKDYKPDINLEYFDDNGRKLSTKEAYKALSHQFHGKNPGKNKVEKQLKRQEEERKTETESIFNPGNLSDKKRKSAGVRIQ